MSDYINPNPLLRKGAPVVHKKTRRLYIFNHTARVEATGEEVAVYISFRQPGEPGRWTLEPEKIWTRPLEQYLDGRFIPLCTEGNLLCPSLFPTDPTPTKP